MISELMMGGSEVGDLCRLHMSKRGMKRVRAKESVSNLLPEEVTIVVCAQNVRPTKSPTLKTRKWKALNTKG